jgi:hypothetical protein
VHFYPDKITPDKINPLDSDLFSQYSDLYTFSAPGVSIQDECMTRKFRMPRTETFKLLFLALTGVTITREHLAMQSRSQLLPKP